MLCSSLAHLYDRPAPRNRVQVQPHSSAPQSNMAGSSVKRLAATLMDASTDKDPDVQEQIYSSLCFMGETAPEEVLQACDSYLRQHDKLSYTHRTIILRAMETVVKNSLSDLSKETAKLTIILASSEMTKCKDIVFEWQQAASNVLVAVGRRYINSVMEEILLKFQPGILPHFFIMQTLANLSMANVFGMVPFLNSILGTMLPMLGLVKQDPMKAVFCVALQHFSESIQEYLANLDKAPDPTVRKDTFSSDLYSAYDVLFNNWLQNRECKVRLAVVEALGPMSHLLPNEKLEEQLSRLLPGILSLYKKNVEPFYVTKSLCQILESAVSNESRTLEPQIDAVLSVLHTQICSSSEAPTQMLVRNRNEVLRCFTVLASIFPDHLLSYLLPKLEANNPKVRVGTLIILKQVINSAASLMDVKKPLILAAVRQPLQDCSNRVRKALVQLISTMAHHGYLEQPGGEVMLDYLIRLCCLSPENSQQQRRQTPEQEEVTEESVRRISINTLYLISTTVERLTNVLWPYLLEFVVPIQFTNALTPLCKSLLHLSQKKKEEGVEKILLNYNVSAHLPSPHALLARLLVVSASLDPGDGRSAAALRLLSVMQINIHPSVGECWEREIPPLLHYLEETSEKLHQQTAWEERLLKFLVGSLQAVSDDFWICQLSQEMRKQLNSYSSALEKSFLYKCIGSSLGACANREVVRKELQGLLTCVRYQDEAEREGLAVALGICSAHHLDDTLEKMYEFLKSDIMKKNTGIFNLFKDRADGDLEKIKSALILGYGYVAVYAPTELVLPRIESDILRNVFLYFHTKVLGIKVEPKDVTLKLSLIRSISMIGLAICSSSQSGFFHFSRKSELISQLVEFLKMEPVDSLKSALRQRALAACSFLVKLEPPLSDADKAELINTALSSVFPLPLLTTGNGELHKETLYGDTMEALKDLLRGLLFWDLTPQGLEEMFRLLNPWIRSGKEQERQRALETSSALLEFYLHKLNVNCVVSFHNLGLLIGRLSPRCSDSLASIRQHTLDCIYYLLYIQLRYEGFASDHKDEQVEKLQTLRGGLLNPDSSVLFHTCFDIAMIIGRRLPPEQLTSLLFITFEGLSDPDSNCSRAATVMINSLLKDRGTILLSKVPEIILRVQEQLEETPEEHVKKAAVQTLYILATQHVKAVVSSLLTSPIPYDSETCTLWRALSSDPPLTSQVLNILLEKMMGDVPYKECKTSLLSSASGRVATLQPLAATCALRELLSQPQSSLAVQELYPPLFVALLLRVSCMVGVQLPKNLGPTKDRRNSSQSSRSLDPCSSAVEALHFMLVQGGSEEVALSVAADGGWENMRKEDTHHVGVSSLSSSMVRHAAPKLQDIVKKLQSAQSSVYDNQRITATAFLAQLLQSSDLADFIFLEPLMDNMTGRLKDSNVTVRMLAVRGLGNIADGYPEKVRKHGSHLLTAMISAMDDRDDPDHIVTQEAMSNLSRLLPHVQDTDMHSFLIHTAIRIRPFFDHEREDLRRSSIILFGNLSQLSFGEEQTLFEQILNGLVTLLLHLQDPKPDVVKACKFALQTCAPSLKNPGLADMFTSYLHPDRGLHYGEFMNNVCKHLLQGHPDLIPRLIQTNIAYFKSVWPDIRAAAPLFIGFLVLHMQPDQCKMVDLDHLVTSLIVLLKDPVPSVRIKASETMGRLVKFV